MADSLTLDPVALTQRLIAFDTVNPPGQEAACAEHLAGLLRQAGFAVQEVPLGPGRCSVVARKGRAGPKGPLVFTGHLDVVPLGGAPWTQPPFGGQIVGDRLYGRGSSDMKSGIAAFVCAAVEEAHRAEDGLEVVLMLTAGEETGCQGAESLVAAGLVERAGALIVGEPTANRPFIGHKGALWLRCVACGKTAHGSMPEAGDNAVYKAARATHRLSLFNFGVPAHPVLGGPTLNVGTFHGGINVNSVPDRATIEVDMRTIPGMAHDRLREEITDVMGEGLEVQTLIDLPGVWTSPERPWVQRAAQVIAGVTGEPFEPRTATFFSDAAVLMPAMGDVPTLILGPGEPQLAHQTDEWCSVERLNQATAIYRRLIVDWAQTQTE